MGHWTLKKRQFSKDSREVILSYAERAAEEGYSEREFSRAIGICRSVLYYWKNRVGMGNRKRGYFKIGMEKINQILRVIKDYKEVASEYFVGMKCGVSTTTVGRVKKMYLPN